jgi:RimJ/RimL family protein N-acetyltransferase
MRNAFLVGDHVYLRPLGEEDAPRATAWMNDREVTRTMAWVGPISLEQEQRFIREAISETTMVLGVVLKQSDELIGATALSGIDHRNRTASYGIVIGAKDLWGMGIGTEVTRLMCVLGFADLNLNRIELEVFADNVGGLNAYERAGFVREGVRRQAGLRGGRPVDIVLMSILREEWKGPE